MKKACRGFIWCCWFYRLNKNVLIGIGCYNIINETYQGEIRGANKGQTELPENGKPKGKQNGKPILPETANGLPLENGFATANESDEQSADGKQICTSGANQRANETANKGQTEIAEKGKPTYLNKNKEILRRMGIWLRKKSIIKKGGELNGSNNPKKE